MESTSINISNSSSASFTLPPASSLNVSGVDGETVDIRASKQLLSNYIWYPAYLPDLMVLELFILSQWTHKHTSFPLSCQENYWSDKPSFILIAWGRFSDSRTIEFLNSPSHQPLTYTCIHTYVAGAGNEINQYPQIYLLFVYILCSEEDATAQSPYHIQTNLQQPFFIPARNIWVGVTQVLQETNVLMVAHPPSESGCGVFSLRTIDCK